MNYFKLICALLSFATIDCEQSLSLIGPDWCIIPLEEDDEAPFYDRFFWEAPRPCVAMITEISGRGQRMG